jgi:hypothetical protein
MNKGGKFIFGKSLIKEDGTLQFPEQAIQEYDIMSEGKIYLITGSMKQQPIIYCRDELVSAYHYMDSESGSERPVI